MRAQTVKLTPNGNSDAVNIPRWAIARLKWRRGDHLVLTQEGDTVTLRSIQEHVIGVAAKRDLAPREIGGLEEKAK